MARAVSMAIVSMMAVTVVQGNECSSGRGCGSDNEPQNAVSLLQTKLQMNVVNDGVEEDGRDLDQLSVREGSILTAASLLTAADSMLTAASIQELVISNAATHEKPNSILTAIQEKPDSIPIAGLIEKLAISNATIQETTVDQDASQEVVLCGVVGVVLLLACCFPLSGFLKLNRQAEVLDPVPKREPSQEVWVRDKRGRRASSLWTLLGKIDNADQCDESPPGYVTRADWAQAMADPQVWTECKRLGLNLSNLDQAFRLLDTSSDGLVDMVDFVNGCLDITPRHH